uniref:SAM domain-containing protein n=1 Tax=Anopheles epiroticus TaxID=199890 RepID=A0A182P7N2_9DIPT
MTSLGYMRTPELKHRWLPLNLTDDLLHKQQQPDRFHEINAAEKCQCKNYIRVSRANQALLALVMLLLVENHPDQQGKLRHDTDERLRRLQKDKESLALQVKTLTEHMQSQSTKISELENTIKEKNQLLTNAEDLLQREMLSRSSLETQKLELMSAMSELKLQQAALERENLELRTNFVTSSAVTGGLLNGNLTNGTANGPAITNVLNNNSITSTENRDNRSSEQADGGVPTRSFTPQPAPSPSMSNKLKNIFGKIKRSNSGTLDDMTTPEGEFKRGGVRATAGARLGWSGTSQYRKPEKPFSEWNIDTICQWLEHLGLDMYEEDLRRWFKSSTTPGSELMKASPVDFEKELSLRNPLHRKKIVLAIADISGSADDDEMLKCAGKLDTLWVQRWLDDVSMPQYKEAFLAARMDGRMLHKLTMDDLAHLQISSCMHVASIRRGIQLMRSEKWNPDCLIRRTMQLSLDAKDDVRLWTSQRVHEWLRAVDLAEYAPNLRGSGVHGALMIFEVKFTAELFADLLSIPPSKTLLRRHLATHFKELLGRDIIQVKREAENTLGFQPLTISAKIKTPKKSQFSLKRKKSNKGGQLGDEWSDYVCPMGGSGQEHLPPASSSASNSTSQSSINDNAASAFTSNASSANTNIVTSIAMTMDPSTVPTAYPGSTTSSTTSTTTSGVGLELASLQKQPSINTQLMTTKSKRLFSFSASSTASSPVLGSLPTGNNRSMQTDNDNNSGCTNFAESVIASFSPVKDVYQIGSANQSNYSSSSSLVSNHSSKKLKSSAVSIIGRKLENSGVVQLPDGSNKPSSYTPIEMDASNAPVQRSASFNSACTVPLSISKTIQVKNSASFSNCSILAKVAKTSAVLAPFTTNPVLKITSNSATNLLKQQTSTLSSGSANSMSNTYKSNITETLANAGSNNSTQAALINKSAAGGCLSLSTGQLPSSSMVSISSTITKGSSASICNPTSLNQSISATTFSLAQLKNNSSVDYYV